jgi:hypothetical protein
MSGGAEIDLRRSSTRRTVLMSTDRCGQHASARAFFCIGTRDRREPMATESGLNPRHQLVFRYRENLPNTFGIILVAAEAAD